MSRLKGKTLGQGSGVINGKEQLLAIEVGTQSTRALILTCMVTFSLKR
jgi:hypothetical protein